MILLLIALLELHAVDGTPIEINPDAIVSLKGKAASDGTNFTPGANCLLNMSDGKFITVRENCSEVLRELRKVREE